MTPEQRDRVEAKRKEVEAARKGQQRKKPGAEQQPAGDEVRQKVIDTDVYYESSRGKFWHLNGRKEWQEATKANLDLVLRANWYSRDQKLANGLSIVESKIHDIIINHSVHYAGALAGWQVGRMSICGKEVLVTTGPKLPIPKRGTFKLLHRFIRELLGEQRVYFNAWLKSAYKSLSEGAPFAPGQMLTLAGPVGCGKGLLQRLVTVMLGGRMANPHRYLSGVTPFNGDLLEAEHLMLEDEEGRTDIKSRRMLGAAIKSMCVNQQQSGHPKGMAAFTTEPFWRVTYTLNDEPENLMALPPMTSDISDKVILLRASQASWPYPSDAVPTRGEFWNQLVAEIPAYLYRLQHWDIPEELRDIRYGVKYFHDPDLLAKLASLSPESKLWAMILESGLLDSSIGIWAGSSVELERHLKSGKNAGQVADLLYYATACGVYLARLAKSMPACVEREDLPGNRTVWHLADDKK